MRTEWAKCIVSSYDESWYVGLIKVFLARDWINNFALNNNFRCFSSCLNIEQYHTIDEVYIKDKFIGRKNNTMGNLLASIDLIETMIFNQSITLKVFVISIQMNNKQKKNEKKKDGTEE